MAGLQGTGRRFTRWIVPVVTVAFSVAAIGISTTFDRMPPILKRGIQPADFPQLIAGLVIVLTALMVWRTPAEEVGNPGRITWLTLLLMGIFVFLTQADFFLALGAFAAMLSRLWGERRPTVLAIVGLFVPLVVFLLFDQVFEVRFPRGILTTLWYG